MVGGAVRDLLLGKAPTDWDFAATLTPTQLLKLFPAAKQIGGNCGTVSLSPAENSTNDKSTTAQNAGEVKADGIKTGKIYTSDKITGDISYEITPCRTESGYSDARHPDEVQFVPSILLDLARRDFTVNAMAYDGEILIDPFGGQSDVHSRILRCVGKPSVRFREDALRILRLFRLSAQLNFTVDWHTFCAAKSFMHSISFLPSERVLSEINRILMGEKPQVLCGIIASGGLSAYGFHFAPSLEALASVPQNLLCRWWALIAMCGAQPQAVGKAFGFSRGMVERLNTCFALYRKGPCQSTVQLKMKMSGTKLDYELIARTFAAVSPPYAAEPAFFASVCANGEPYRLSELAINGDILRQEGITGEKCGLVLNALLRLVIKNPKLNEESVLRKIARNIWEIL